MAEYLIQGSTLTGIADAIRQKTGTTAALAPGQMAAAISNISTGTAGESNFLDITLENDIKLNKVCIAESIPFVAAHMNDENFFLMFAAKELNKVQYFNHFALAGNSTIFFRAYSLLAGYSSTITSMGMKMNTAQAGAANSASEDAVYSRVYAAEGGAVYLTSESSYEIWPAGNYTLFYGAF